MSADELLADGDLDGLANHRDLEIEDDLARAQKALRDLKAHISSQSKKNFVLEKDVRYLDSRIALLIQNRMALEEVCCEMLPFNVLIAAN